ncbi:MAG: PHP domain-containing protein [Actinobacteria bacterium]|nr:PHP domain-containing protein [Actinomycetota bacterium]MDI6832002.1 PHP domain-containing protein [Actinomycetota bacterium]
MVVDLHVHTRTSSRCSEIAPPDMIVQARAMGLDAVAVTEHGTMHGALVARELGREEGFTVFAGVEVYTPGGDLLVFGVRDELLPDMAFEELHALVREEGGMMVLAHPARGYWGHRRRYKGFPPREVLRMVDAVEVLNGCCSYHENVLATRMAHEMGLPQVGGSDAHDLRGLGRCVTVLPRAAGSEEELVAMVKGGECRAAYIEDALPRASHVRPGMAEDAVRPGILSQGE